MRQRSPQGLYSNLMPKKLLKSKKEVEKKVKVKKPEKISKELEEKLEFSSDAPVRGFDLSTQPVPELVVEPAAKVVVDFLPEGVFKKEVVEINGRKYNKFWHTNGTTSLELLK